MQCSICKHHEAEGHGWCVECAMRFDSAKKVMFENMRKLEEVLGKPWGDFDTEERQELIREIYTELMQARKID